MRDATYFAHDPPWKDLVGRGGPRRAVVLVAGKETLLERLKQREHFEGPGFPNPKALRYNVPWWRSLVEQVDLGSLHRAWCRWLRDRGIEYVIVDGTTDAYSVIENENRLATILDDEPSAESAYTKEQIEDPLRGRSFEYHRVSLPYGLHTEGDDRSATRDLVLPKSLAGKSVLDVGSALGYFCFEAEARGAERVVGVELRGDRFRDAMLLKDIKGSNVEFVQRDIVLDPPDESLDYVLLLNVVHHLNEPFRAMRQLASMTRERLIIEFPTLADRKFRKSVKIRFPAPYNRLPLVGVSSMRPGVKQTFVFTPSAIKRAMMDHERLFEQVEVLRSPMPGRAIAICQKESSG